MSAFSQKMGRKANQGNMNYNEYSSEYTNLSPEEQEQLMQEARLKVKKALIFGIVLLVLLPFITRKNHRYYVLDHGELVPVEFEGGIRGGTMPQPGMVGPYGQAPYPAEMGQQQYSPQQMNMQQQQQQYQMQQPAGYSSPHQNYQAQGHSPYSPYAGQQNSSFDQIARNVAPAPGQSRQSNYQPSYSGPVAPQ